MKFRVIMISSLLFATAALASVRPHDQDTGTVAQAGKMFQANCIACHQVPDRQFAVDRAWLKQLEHTA